MTPTSPVRPSGLRSVALGTPDVAAAEKFYTSTWALTPVARQDGAVYLRGSGSPHHLLSLHPRPRAELLDVCFNAASRADVDALALAVRNAGAGPVGETGAAKDPAGGYGFSFRDPEGRRFTIVAGDATHADAAEKADVPDHLSHVVLCSADVPTATAFFTDVLGFRVSDRTKMMNFVRCNSDHHQIALAYAEASSLNHIAFCMPDLESVMRGAGRVKDAGYPIEWGVGRHGPGNNVFAYFIGPDEVVIEYTSEVEKVDDNYVVRGPEEWKWPPGRTDQWGISAPPSPRLQAAQKKIRFAGDIEPGAQASR